MKNDAVSHGTFLKLPKLATPKTTFVSVNPTDPDAPLVLSYLGMRKAVGIIGVALPFALALGNMIRLERYDIEGSISYYYYTDMRNVFVGSLCAIAVFLMSTRGYDRRDAIAGRLACIFAIGVAFFRTSPAEQVDLIGAVHLTFAGLFFLTLAYFCLRLFTETAPSEKPTPQKRKRNTVYRICGYTILASIATLGILRLAAPNFLEGPFKPVFVFESTAVIAFGLAWLVKGETILKD